MAREWSHRLPELWRKQGGLCAWCQGITLMVGDFLDAEEYAWPYPRLWTYGGRRVPRGSALREWTPHWIELFGRPFLKAPVARLGDTLSQARGQFFPVATVDHVRPRRSGHDPLDVENMVMACKPCNNARDTLPPEGFLRYLGLDPAALIPAGVELQHPA